jgi:hypothetical protein
LSTLDALGGESEKWSKSAVSIRAVDPKGATMLADPDLLLSAVFGTADDLLPDRRENARRSVTDAEAVALCVAQAVMNIASDREFLAVAGKHLQHLFPKPPKQPGFHKRRRRLADTIEWLIGLFAQDSPRPLRQRGAARLDPG